MMKMGLGLVSLLGGAAVGGAILGSLSTSSALRNFTVGSVGVRSESASNTNPPVELRAEGALPALARPLQVNDLQELTEGLRTYLLHRDPKTIPIVGKYALMGEPRAQGLIASMYIRGEGLPLDRAEGIRWLRLAAAQGGHAERDYLIAVTDGMVDDPGMASLDQRHNQVDHDRAIDPRVSAFSDGSQNLPKSYNGGRSSAYAASLEAAPLPLPTAQRRVSVLDGPSASRQFLERELAFPSRVGASTVVLNRAGPGTYSNGNGDIYAQAGPHGVVNTQTGEFSPTN